MRLIITQLEHHCGGSWLSREGHTERATASLLTRELGWQSAYCPSCGVLLPNLEKLKRTIEVPLLG